MLTVNEQVCKRFRRLSYAGSMDIESATVIYDHAVLGSFDAIKLFVTIEPLSHTITKIRFLATGNPYLMTLLDVACEWLTGKPCLEVEQLSSNWLVNALDIPSNQQHHAYEVVESFKQLANRYGKQYED